MNVTLWIVASLLAAAFLAAGATKLVKPRSALVENGMGWAEDFSEPNVKLIGLVEVVGAIGIIVPAAFGFAEILTPVAAAGLAVTMVGAVAVHVRRGETTVLAPPAVLGVLAVVVAILRFGPYSF